MKRLLLLLPVLLPMLTKAQCSASFTVIANPSTAVCPGSSVTYSASGTLLATFSWSNGSTNSSITISAQPNTQYVVNVIDSNGCTGTDTIVPNLSNLKATITFTSTPCSPSITILTANGTGGATPYTYTWYNASGDYSTDTIPTPVYSPSCPGCNITLPSYSVAITDLNGCTSSAQVGILPRTPLSVSLPGTYSVCAGQGGPAANGQIGLSPTITGGSATTLQYLWSTGATTPFLSFQGLSSGIYSITVTDINGCTASASDTLTVFPTPKITLTSTKNPIQIGWIDTLIATNGTSYLWSNDSTEASILVRPRISTDYWVTGWNNYGCSNTAYTTIVVSRDYFLPSPDTLIPHYPGFPPIYYDGNVSIGGDSAYNPTQALAVHGNVLIDSVLTVKDTLKTNVLQATTYKSDTLEVSTILPNVGDTELVMGFGLHYVFGCTSWVNNNNNNNMSLVIQDISKADEILTDCDYITLGGYTNLGITNARVGIGTCAPNSTFNIMNNPGVTNQFSITNSSLSTDVFDVDINGNTYAAGNVGIGIQNPIAQFQVNPLGAGSGQASSISMGSFNEWNYNPEYTTSYIGFNLARSIGNNGTWTAGSDGVSNGGAAITVNPDGNLYFLNVPTISGSGGTVVNNIGTDQTILTNNITMMISKTGNVGIGTTNIPSGYLLAVNGSIIAGDVMVMDPSSWPDYVFNKNHHLQSLEELEKYLNLNHHLPGLPSEDEIKKKGGVSVEEMLSAHTEKLEELTLYIIQLNKEMKELKAENEKLKEEIKNK